MIANPPDDPTANQGHISIAWPLEILFDSRKNNVIGFLMPRISGAKELIKVYHPGTRRKECPLFNWKYLHYTAANLASAISAIHDRNYCIGDLRENNILVNDKALVTLIDVDSFQVRHSSGKLFRCPVGTPEFTPPELMGFNFSQVDRGVEHDRFGLAILIFKLLMEGYHPFDALDKGAGESPTPEERICGGYYPYDQSSGRDRFFPPPHAPSFEIQHPRIQQLFNQCFVEGHSNSLRRPSALAWKKALTESVDSLRVCHINPQHYFHYHLRGCPWCKRKEKYGRDSFPSRDDIRHTVKQPQPNLSSKVPSTATLSSGLPQAPSPYIADYKIFFSYLIVGILFILILLLSLLLLVW